MGPFLWFLQTFFIAAIATSFSEFEVGQQSIGQESMAAALRPIRFFGLRPAKVTHPTGDPKFKVLQSFPAGFDQNESDPFLMCDHWGPTPSSGVGLPVDDFDVPWHPHRGMDILTYMLRGVGRHGDSLGNREIFSTPGCQWISVGSGIEHAEGGAAVPKGQMNEGFQIWVNVPSAQKMNDPRYGTHNTDELPLLSLAEGKVTVRLLAGRLAGAQGPFQTTQSIQIADYVISAGGAIGHTVDEDHDNVLIYCYEGEGKVGPQEMKRGQVVRFGEDDGRAGGGAAVGAGAGRTIQFSTGGSFKLIVFAGKRLNQPIAWHGPIVMTNQDEIRTALAELRAGTFLKKRVPWDFKKASAFPEDRRPKQ